MGAASFGAHLRVKAPRKHNLSRLDGPLVTCVRFYRRGIEPGLRTRFAIKARRVCHSAIPPVKNNIFFMTLYSIFYDINIADHRQ